MTMQIESRYSINIRDKQSISLTTFDNCIGPDQLTRLDNP
jgi:hypothetical protein